MEGLSCMVPELGPLSEKPRRDRGTRLVFLCVACHVDSGSKWYSSIDESRGLPPGVRRVLQLALKSRTDKERQRNERGLSILEREKWRNCRCRQDVSRFPHCCPGFSTKLLPCVSRKRLNMIEDATAIENRGRREQRALVLSLG